MTVQAQSFSFIPGHFDIFAGLDVDKRRHLRRLRKVAAGQSADLSADSNNLSGPPMVGPKSE